MDKKEIPFNRILVIDDSEVDYFIASKIIRRHKPFASLYHAPDVDGALNMLRLCAPAEVPDLILLDLNFERQNKQGVDFLKEYRALHPIQSSATQVMVLTAYSGFKDVIEVRKIFSDTVILEKPFKVEKLMAG